jgi:hypothetical protein
VIIQYESCEDYYYGDDEVLLVLAVDGQDDAGADLDMEAMAGGDAGSAADYEAEVVEKEKSMIEQTSLAIQQCSIIIGNFF